MNRPETVSALSIRLPQADRSVETYKLSAPKSFPDRVSEPMNRIAFSAAHVGGRSARRCGPMAAGRHRLG
jgi:hypothetical protein